MSDGEHHVKKDIRGSKLGNPLSDVVGERLQSVRKMYGLSQRELARRAEMTNSTLSMIEQGKVSPSITSLEKILLAFPMSLQEFFAESLELASSVVYQQDFVHVNKGGVDHHMMPLEGVADGAAMSIQYYPPDTEVDSEWMISKGFIGGILAKGSLELHLEGVEYILHQGDGFHFSLQRRHTFKNVSSEECILVCVSSDDKNK